MFRKNRAIKQYTKERISTADDDFLDLNWIRNSSEKLVIISHGLEGNSHRGYVLGMANAFSFRGFDVLAWNYRGCGDEINGNLRFYHSGATEDLDQVVQFAINKNRYKEIHLIGFSLGGNLTLKFLGERAVHPTIKKAVVFSVPCHLHSSCLELSKLSNRVYSNRFLKSLKAKIIAKAKQFEVLDVSKLDKVKSLIEFDNCFTAPLHGFKDAIDYYTKCSSVQFLKTISIPTLIVNAANDPFLSEQCYPKEIVKNHPFVTLEIPERGGHVGFTLFNSNGVYWSELRALNFIINE